MELPYSHDLRERVIDAAVATSRSRAADPFEVGIATAIRWAANRDAFQAYIARTLVPELTPGDIVVMDNLPSQKGPAVQVAIEAVGARLLYLPSYSPDLNPIDTV